MSVGHTCVVFPEKISSVSKVTFVNAIIGRRQILLSNMSKEKLEKVKENLRQFKQKRGGTLLDFHKRLGNDPELLRAYTQGFDVCMNELVELPPKYKELIIFAIGCVRGIRTTMDVHSKLAVEHGATIEELCEVLRLVFFLCGATTLIPAVEILEKIEEE